MVQLSRYVFTNKQILLTVKNKIKLALEISLEIEITSYPLVKKTQSFTGNK